MMAENLMVLGAGESGTGAALLARAKGIPVFVSDNGAIGENYRQILIDQNIPFEEEGHNLDNLDRFTEVIKSPGIPEKTPVILTLKDKGIPVISELEFAHRYTKAKIIAITGTNGKTTTTLLTHHILKTAGIKAGLAGNIGKSLAQLVIDDDFDHYVLEVSSFQLDGMFKFRSDIAVLLNITADHLDRYRDFEHYTASKFRITQNMTGDDSFIYFADDQVISTELGRQQLEAAKFAVSLATHQNPGAYALDDHIHFNISLPAGGPFEIAFSEIPLEGPHNMVNAMAASLAALLSGVPLDQLVQALNSFKNVAHRMEYLGEIQGATYINDSKATNVDATFYALKSFDKPLIWIAGGIDKGNNYQLIEDLVASKVKTLICLGKDNTSLKQAFGALVREIIEVESMEAAMEAAQESATYGDIVLLSPACASFDLFKNYQDRGNQFKQLVELKKKDRVLKELA